MAGRHAGVSGGVGECLKIGKPELAVDLQLEENDLPSLVDGEDVEAILVLRELRELRAEDEKRLPSESRVCDKPLLKLCLRDPVVEDNRLEHDRVAGVDLNHRRSELLHRSPG